MNDIAKTVSIIIKVVDQTQGAFGKLAKELKEVEAAAPGASRGVDKLTKSAGGIKVLSGAFGGLVTQIAAVVSVAAGLQKMVGVTREFDKLSAGLITATGSAQGSEQAFAAIQDFAATTPYDLQQTTEAFTKLVNYGLDPSERALTSYGNTASALGKDIVQMVEAVADAQTGEFERLKGFGIKASKEGDKVSFTFRGTTTTVKNSAAEIEQYLIKLGETNFGDAMANRMQTLDGAMSNLADEWGKLFLNVSNAGVGEAITDAVRIGISALEELNAMVASGEIEGYLDAIASAFSWWGKDVDETVSLVTRNFGDELSTVQGYGKETVDFLIDAFRLFPQNVKAFIGLMTVEVAAGLDKVQAYAAAFAKGVKAIFSDETVAGVGQQLEKELGIINAARNASIDGILAERQASVESFNAKIDETKKLRAEYDAQRAAEKADHTDRLAQFKIQGDMSKANTTSAKGEAKAKREAAAAAKKETAELKRQQEEQARVNAEKLRAASQERIISMEQEKLEASKLPTALQRAEATLAIEKRITAERIALKRQEIDAIKADPEASQAEIIRAESELADMRLEVSRQELEGQREIAQARLAAIGDSWRRSAQTVEEYKQAVTEAYSLGLMETKEYNDKMILASNDLAAGLNLGFNKAMDEMRTDAEVMAEIGQQLPSQLSSGFTSLFSGIITDSKSALESFRDMALSMIDFMTQIIMKQMVLQAMGFFGLGLANGGQVPGQALASGGRVAGSSPTDTADNVPIWATAGEFMQPVRAVRHYGLAFMEAIRTLSFPRADAMAMLKGFNFNGVMPSFRLAMGGPVPSAAMASMSAGSTTVKGGDVKLRVTNVIDKDMMGDYMRTHQGETHLLNFIKKNGSTIKTLLG